MKTLFLLPEFRFFLCFFLFCLCMLSTLDLINCKLEENNEKENLTSKEEDPFYNEDGNHTYYDRSLIKKMKFFRHNPNIPPAEIRSFKRLLKSFKSFLPSFNPNR